MEAVRSTELEDADRDDGSKPAKSDRTVSYASMRAAHDVAFDALRKGAEMRSSQVEEPVEIIGDAPNDFKDKIVPFLIHCLTILAPFAAVRHNKCGKGALFLFSRCCWMDLLEIAATGPHKSQDRHVLAVWGVAAEPCHDDEPATLSISALMKRC